MIYKYKGPVKQFGRVVCDQYEAYTTAPTPGRALVNISARYKKEHGLLYTAKIELMPELLKENEKCN